jgi:hypothetical protein
MKTKSLFAGLACFAIVVAVPAARAAVLNFEGDAICTSDSTGIGVAVGCTNSTYILQSYGDMAGVVDVSYAAPRYVDGRSLRWWNTSYNELGGVLWADGGDGNSRAVIEIKPLNGMAVVLTHFDMGSYPGGSRDTTLKVTDLLGNVLMLHEDSVGEPGNLSTPFNGSWSSISGIRIEWEDSAYNVGIDNITYNMAPVPEPSTYAMLGAGLALLGVAARRRKA